MIKGDHRVGSTGITGISCGHFLPTDNHQYRDDMTEKNDKQVFGRFLRTKNDQKNRPRDP
jgi:hypothetical protein